MNLCPTLLSIAAACLPAAFSTAQARQLPVAPATIVDQAVGLSTVDGETWGIGPDYRVRFHDDGPEFSPVGASSLRLRLASVRRGRESLPVERAELELHGQTAVYRRKAFDERYEVRPEGMEQSFLLRALPPGNGDLVVALEARTDLVASTPPDPVRGVVLTGAAREGIRVGGVTAIDAEGKRVSGRVHWRSGRLELVVPAEFVRNAALPLIVDPLFGAVVDIDRGSGSVNQVAVAHEPGSGRFLVVWTPRGTGGASTVVLGQLVNDRGALVGGVITVARRTSTSEKLSLIGAATVDSANTFVVLWNGTGGGKVRAVSTTGNLGQAIRVGSEARAIAGSLGSDDSAYVVSVADSLGTFLIVHRFRVTSAQVLRLERRLVVEDLPRCTSGCITSAQISRTDGPHNRYLVVWTRPRAGTGAMIQGVVIDRFPRMLGPKFTVKSFKHRGSTNEPFPHSPVVAGDGTSWLVAYNRNENESGSGPNDVRCRRVVFNAIAGRGQLDGPEVAVAARAGINERVLGIARLRQSYLLCVHDHRTPVLLSLDPANCTRCEGRFRLDVDTSIGGAAIATPQTGSDSLTSRRSLVVWKHHLKPVRGRLFSERDGDYKSLGGGCGQGGEAVASCTRVGNTRFTVGLQGAAPRAPAFLMFGASKLDLRCGPCRLVPSPFLALPIATTNQGTAAIRLGIPNDTKFEGLSYMVQWGLFRSGGGCNNLLELSNALQVVYER